MGNSAVLQKFFILRKGTLQQVSNICTMYLLHIWFFPPYLSPTWPHTGKQHLPKEHDSIWMKSWTITSNKKLNTGKSHVLNN
jgi:hypothetical protein